MMKSGPTLIYDKSVIEGMSTEAAHWLHHHFHAVVAPPLLIEVIGNLKKSRGGKTGEELVASIAAHMPSYAVTPTMDYRELFTHELMGGALELGRRPYLAGGRRVRAADGSQGLVYDEPPEVIALRRWQSGDFNGLERAMADQWQDSLKALDLKALKQHLKGIKVVFGKTPAPRTVLQYVDDILLNGERYRTLSMGLEMMNTPPNVARVAIRRWKVSGRPKLQHFAPYFNYLVRIEMFFSLLIASDVISNERPKHRADFLYFYYLPFTSIFTSNDKLHIQLAPLLMGLDQMFVSGEDLREDMNKLARRYSNLPKDIQETGSMTYAAFPPRDGDFLTATIYDRLMPNWRDRAAIPKKPITREENAKIMAHLKPMIDAISALNKNSGS